MPDRDEISVEQITQAKRGDEAVVNRLLERVGPRIRRAIEVELQAANVDDDTATIWSDVQAETRQRLANFDGKTEIEFAVWAERLALRLLRQSYPENVGNIETIVADTDASESVPVTQAMSVDAHATMANQVESPTDPDLFATQSQDPNAPTIQPTDALPAEHIKTFGDYDILGTIARGGMGVVYRARQRKLNRIVALKMILAGQLAEQKDIDRFYAEAEAAAQLRHPNIVGIHEVGECDGQHFFSMEYIEGRPLHKLVHEHPLPPRTAAKMVAAIAAAMHYAHEAGVLHRDLKPSNVLVDENDEPLVTDFGLAKRTAAQSQITVAGTILGTPSYMPPEQALGQIDKITARSDVYSTGAILYELVTGKPPFAASTPWETINQVLTSEPVAPRTLNNTIPPDLETICLKCLHKDQDRRYASAQDLADELQRFLEGKPILARPIGFVEQTVRWCYRNPWPTAALVVLLFAVAGTTTGFYKARVAQQQAESSRDQLMAAINELFTAWGDVTLLNEPGFEDVRAQLLATANNLYSRMGDQLGDDPKIQHELGVSYFRLGRMMFHLRSYEDARSSIEAALRVQREQVDARPTGEAQLHALGESLNLYGNLLEVTAARSGASGSSPRDQLNKAETIYDEAIDVRTELLGENSSNPAYARQLANSQMNRAMVRQRMGDLLADAGNIAEAKLCYNEAKSRLEEVQRGRRELLDGLDNTSTVRRDVIHDLAKGYYNIANVTWWLGDFDATQNHIASAVSEFDALLADEPDDLANQFDQGLCLMLGGDATSEQMASLTEEQQQEHSQLYTTTFQSYERAKSSFEKLVEGSSSVPKYKRALAQVLMRIGDLHFLTQQDQQALAAFQSASDLLAPLVDQFPAYQQLLDQADAGIADARQFISESASSKQMEHETQPRPGERSP